MDGPPAGHERANKTRLRVTLSACYGRMSSAASLKSRWQPEEINVSICGTCTAGCYGDLSWLLRQLNCAFVIRQHPSGSARDDVVLGAENDVQYQWHGGELRKLHNHRNLTCHQLWLNWMITYYENKMLQHNEDWSHSLTHWHRNDFCFVQTRTSYD